MPTKKQFEEENEILRAHVTSLEMELAQAREFIGTPKESILEEILRAAELAIDNNKLPVIPASDPPLKTYTEGYLNQEFRKWIGHAVCLAMWDKLREVL